MDGALLLRDGRLIQRIGLDERVGIFRYPIETPPDSPSMRPNQFFSFTILSSTVSRYEDLFSLSRTYAIRSLRPTPVDLLPSLNTVLNRQFSKKKKVPVRV
jgi:hypothetical protein